MLDVVVVARKKEIESGGPDACSVLAAAAAAFVQETNTRSEQTYARAYKAHESRLSENL